jgi:heme exporter protein D
VVAFCGRLPRGGWKTVDPLYVWSAAVGLFVALVLIAVAQVMQTGRLH